LFVDLQGKPIGIKQFVSTVLEILHKI